MASTRCCCRRQPARARRLELSRPLEHAPAQQQPDDGRVDRHLGIVALRRAHPEEVQQPEQHDRIDGTVQCLPARRPECLDRAIERGRRERQHQQQRARADEDERALRDVAHDVAPDQAHVEPAVAEKVQAAVEEREQAQHAAKARQCRLAGELAQRRHGQREAQQAQCPVTGGTDQRFGRVRAERVLAHHAEDRAAQQPGEGQQADHEQHELRGRSQQHRLRLRGPHGGGARQRGAAIHGAVRGAQKFFFRSSPAYSDATCGP